MADEDRNLDAAERALGTLPLTGESAKDRRLREDWDRHLAPLLDNVAPVTPPPGILDRIESVIDRDAISADLAEANARVRTWKRVAVLASSVAAAMAIWVAVPHFSPAPRYLAVVSSDSDGTPGLIVQLDTGTGVATVIPLVASAPEGRSLEMWHLPQGATRPHSIGLLPQNAATRTSLNAGVGDTFAISYEPVGGSPTGQPTDPRYHGTIVQID